MESYRPTTSQRLVHCHRHGDNREAFRCKHLLFHSGLSFVSDAADPNNPYPDAWCSECEQVRIESGGEFNDEYARSVIKLVCGDCYNEIKAKHVVETGKS